jgi:predicted  nucleic acid-binding Zn-ribbon protein
MLKQVADIRDRLDRGPRKIKLVSANEASFLAELVAAKEAVTKTRMAADAKQMQLAEREAKIVDLKGRLNSCDSNKEFQLLKDRIAADEQANSVLQDEILEQLEKLDTLMLTSETAKSNHVKSQAEARKITEQVELEMKALRLELERVSAELAETEKGLPIDVLADYRRSVAARGEDALGETDTETCGNCNQRITTQMADNLMMKRSIQCQGCGCILYLASSHPASS